MARQHGLTNKLVAALVQVLLPRCVNAANFFGTECHTNNLYVKDTCKDHGAELTCLPGVIPNCVSWTRGQFRPPLEPAIRPPARGGADPEALCPHALTDGDWRIEPLPAPVPSLCPFWWPNSAGRNCTRGWDSEFRQMPARFWYPFRCDVYMPTPGELLHLLRGRSMLILGDSMFRQIYLRLIHYIRGGEIFYERYFHSDALYAFNATHDFFNVTEDWEQAPVPEGGARIIFRWAEHSLLFNDTMSLNPKLMVAGGMYHYDAHYIPYQWRAQVHRLNEANVSIFYVNTPVKRNPGVLDTYALIRRNYEMYRVLHGMAEYVAFDDMVNTAPYIRRDNTHFACTHGVPHTEPMKQDLPTPDDDKLGRCRDPVNLSLLRVILSVAWRKHVLGIYRRSGHHAVGHAAGHVGAAQAAAGLRRAWRRV